MSYSRYELPRKVGTMTTIQIKLKPFFTRLKQQTEENPLLALTVVTGLTIALTRLMQANTERRNANTWAKEVERRRMIIAK